MLCLLILPKYTDICNQVMKVSASSSRRYNPTMDICFWWLAFSSPFWPVPSGTGPNAERGRLPRYFDMIRRVQRLLLLELQGAMVLMIQRRDTIAGGTMVLLV